MKFVATPLAGAFLIEGEPRRDERGAFARTFCQEELGAAGLFRTIAQCSVSHNTRRGTLRGLHFQEEPYAEEKIVSCTRGAVFDVIVDLRAGSPTFGRHLAQELTPDGFLSLYVPKGFAHGFQTLASDSVVFYVMSEFYKPQAASGVRWNDPDIGIAWPLEDPFMSERDAALPTVVEWQVAHARAARGTAAP
jgi:dTDP-4-dehydrorhamnose 3,5-epimerase